MADTPGGAIDDAAPARKLAEIVIDDATWTGASEARRREWRAVLDDLLAEHHFEADLPDALRLFVTSLPGRVLVDARRANAADESALREEIALADIEGHLREYLRICSEMGELDEGGGSPRLEVMDMAKRLVHDDAGKAVQRLFRSLRPDHATARRLFTLILTLHIDTTRLVRPHHLDATLERRGRLPRSAHRGD